MNRRQVADRYFKWLSNLVYSEIGDPRYSFSKLLRMLHNIEFQWDSRFPRDENRYEDGIEMRYRFADTCEGEDVNYIADCLENPCSMLEMMAALAVRCEETIMDDPAIGDRTKQWFWRMVNSLGLSDMFNENFDLVKVEQVIERFLDRDYEPNGRGGLFTIENTRDDLRKVEIFCQLTWYLGSIS